MSLITQANSHNILCKIGAAKTRTRVDKAAPGVHDDTARVRILTESDIIFCHHVTFYSSSDWSRARLFAKGIDRATARSSFVLYCCLTTLCHAFRVLSTATVLRDVFIVAFGVHVVVVLTHTPLVNEESTPRRRLMRRW